MSNLLIAAILVFCPGHDYDDKGQVITNECQEYMNNCMINKVGIHEPGQKEFDECSISYSQRGRSSEAIPSKSQGQN